MVNSFDESQHPRGRAGKFSPRVGAEQTGGLDEDSAEPEAGEQQWTSAGFTSLAEARSWAEAGHEPFESGVYRRAGLAPDASVEQRHRALMLAWADAQAEVDSFRYRSGTDDPAAIAREHGQRWYAANERAYATGQAIYRLDQKRARSNSTLSDTPSTRGDR